MVDPEYIQDIAWALFVGVAFLSLACEFMDASLGMGYGTTLTPLLLIIGFDPIRVVSAVLLGQLAGGVVGGIAHARLGNVKLDFRRDEEVQIKNRLRWLGYIPKSIDSKIIFILALCGVIGAIVGVFTAGAISKFALSLYIGIMVFVIGVIILIRRQQEGRISWKALVGVGLVSAFNKGMSGGGYGPLVTGGQIISGAGAKSSVANTTIAEAVVCVVGFVTYLLTMDIFWILAAATSVGSIIAAPFAAMVVKKVSANKLKLAIGVITIILGIVTLLKAYGIV